MTGIQSKFPKWFIQLGFSPSLYLYTAMGIPLTELAGLVVASSRWYVCNYEWNCRLCRYTF